MYVTIEQLERLVELAQDNGSSVVEIERMKSTDGSALDLAARAGGTHEIVLVPSGSESHWDRARY